MNKPNSKEIQIYISADNTIFRHFLEEYRRWAFTLLGIASICSNNRLFVSLKSAEFQEFVAKVIGEGVGYFLGVWQLLASMVEVLSRSF